MLKNTRFLSTVAAAGFGLSLILRFIAYVVQLVIYSMENISITNTEILNIFVGIFDTLTVAGMIITLLINKDKFLFSIPTVFLSFRAFIHLLVTFFNFFYILRVLGSDYYYFEEASGQLLLNYAVSILSGVLSSSGYFMLAIIGICYSVGQLRGKYLNYVWFIPGIFFGISTLLSFVNVAFALISNIIKGYSFSFYDIISYIPAVIGVCTALILTVAALAAGKWSVTGKVEPSPAATPVEITAE
ncbi:MAG: hypothetical protein IJW48_04285 [Clostridia bacterium]|nr:hypothetical protein [Clostridia bacterium]